MPESPETSQHNLTSSNLVATIAISLLLHVAAASFLFLGNRGGDSFQSASFIELNMSSPPTSGAFNSDQSEILDNLQPTEPTEPEPVNASPQSEVDKLQSQLNKAVEAASVEKAVEQTSKFSIGLSVTKGYFRSLAEGESLRDDIKSYYLDVLQQINARWWVDQKVTGNRVSAVMLNIVIARNGEILAKEIIQSSGNQQYDQSILNALGGLGNLPPLPESYRGAFFQVPLRLVPPLNLLAS